MRYLKKSLENYLRGVFGNTQKFPIHLKGFEKAVDHWLFLTVQEGNDKIVRLHDELYRGPLEKYLRPDLPFIPHIALGLFAAKDSGYSLENPQIVGFDEVEYKRALEEAENLDLDYSTEVDKVKLLKLEKDLRTIVEEKEFTLKDSS